MTFRERAKITGLIILGLAFLGAVVGDDQPDSSKLTDEQLAVIMLKCHDTPNSWLC